MTASPGEPALSPRFLLLSADAVRIRRGHQILLLALAWQMYDLTSSAWNLGLVGLMQLVPTLLLTIPSGQLADRMDRRRLIAAAIALQLGTAAILTLGTIEHWVDRELILGLSVLIGRRAPCRCRHNRRSCRSWFRRGSSRERSP